MSLDDLIPDDAGEGISGRPSEESNEPKGAHGDPLTKSKDTEEWWEDKWNEFISGDEPTIEEITKLSDYIAVRPAVIKDKVTRYGIYEFDQEAILEDYPSYMKEGYWSGGDNDEEEYFTSTDKDEETDKDTNRSGLLGLIDDAKRKEDED